MDADLKTKVIKVKPEDYVRMHRPAPGWVIIERDDASDKWGSILIPQSVRKRMVNRSSTGKIVAVSPYDPPDQGDKYLANLYELGDRVGFVETTPIGAPKPPNYDLDIARDELDRFAAIHVADIIDHFRMDVMEEIEAKGKQNG